MIHIREVYFKLLSTKLNYKNSNAYIYIWGLCHVLKQEPGQFFSFLKKHEGRQLEFPQRMFKRQIPTDSD